MKIPICGILLPVVVFFTGAVPAQAFHPRQISSEYVDNGAHFLKRNEIVSAVEQFMKALILDHQNLAAKVSLQKIASGKTETLSPRQRLQIKYFLEMVDYLKFLSARVEDFSRRNERIYDFLMAHCPSDEIGKAWVNIVRDTWSRQEMEDDFAFIMQTGKPEDDFRYYNEALSHRKKALWNMLEKGLLTNKEWRRVKSEILSRTRTPVSSREAQGIPADGEIDHRPCDLSRPSDGRQPWQIEAEDLRAQMTTMKKKMEANDRRLSVLTKEIAGLSLELFEKDRIIADKDTHLTEIQTMLFDTQARLMLVQRIIQEKDDEIAKLTAQVKGVATDAPVPGDQPETGDSSDLRALIRDELHEQIRIYKKQIQSLDEQFAQMRASYQKLETDLSTRDEKISQLAGMVERQEAMIKRQELISLSKDEKLLQMDGIIKIYKGRLDDVYAELKQKEERLEILQRQLTGDVPAQF